MSLRRYVLHFIRFFTRRKLSVAKDELSQCLISIIIPTYNAEKTLSDAIKSIQAQSVENLEILIVDDGSNDGTLDLLNKILAEDGRIRIFENSQNKGAAYSKNIGLLFAKGEYITFHDADDVSHPDRLERQLSELLLNDKKIISICKYQRKDTQGNSLIINGKQSMNYVSGMMFKKELIDKIGYFKDSHISEDSEYHERIIATYGKNSRKIINEILYYALFNPHSLLMSNANVEIKGKKINYKITNEHASVLEAYRKEHKQIKAGMLNPYQSFEADTVVTSIYK